MSLSPPARSGRDLDAGQLFVGAESDFARYEVVKDLVDECIDLALDYRQSGHPGGSRSNKYRLVSDSGPDRDYSMRQSRSHRPRIPIIPKPHLDLSGVDVLSGRVRAGSVGSLSR